ncbi:MAG TPA: DUF4336 domain-containing protein [Phenylobacterium sp.]
MTTSVLQPFGPEIWLSDGPETEVIGFLYPTRMAVIRLPGDGLFIWSPIALSDSLREELASLGAVHYLVAPNSLHHLFLEEWRQVYPLAKLYAAPGLSLRRKDLHIDAELEGEPPPQWSGSLDQILMPGNRISTEVVFFHRRSGTVLFTDLLQQFPPGWFRGWRALIARLDLMTGSEPAVPRKFRAAFVDRRAAREALRRILEWPSSGVVVAHGAPVKQDGQAFIARAFRWLTG